MADRWLVGVKRERGRAWPASTCCSMRSSPPMAGVSVLMRDRLSDGVALPSEGVASPGASVATGGGGGGVALEEMPSPRRRIVLGTLPARPGACTGVVGGSCDSAPVAVERGPMPAAARSWASSALRLASSRCTSDRRAVWSPCGALLCAVTKGSDADSPANGDMGVGAVGDTRRPCLAAARAAREVAACWRRLRLADELSGGVSEGRARRVDRLVGAIPVY